MARFNKDTTGASAYSPAMLLKIIPFAYSQGIVSSRDIKQYCDAAPSLRYKQFYRRTTGNVSSRFTTHTLKKLICYPHVT